MHDARPISGSQVVLIRMSLMRFTRRLFTAALSTVFLTMGGLTSARALAAGVDIPVMPIATDQSQKEYHQFPPPPEHPDPHITDARVVIYHLPTGTTVADVSDFYAKALAKANWSAPVVNVILGEKYFIYSKDSWQLVIHAKDQNGLIVDCMALQFDKVDSPGVNPGEITLNRKLDQLPAGAPIDIDCPDGTVTVDANNGAGVDFTVQVRAAVGYPLMAETFIKKVQLQLQTDGGAETLGVDPATVPDDPSVNMVYNYRVGVPIGAHVVIKVDRAANAVVQASDDGRVAVMGGAGDVDISTAGPVTVAGASGKVNVDTSGPIILRGLQSDITAHTNGMSIKAEGITLAGAIDLETSDCQLDLGLAAVKDGSVKLVTSDSAIRLFLPAEASVDLTVAGANKCEGPITVSPVAAAGAAKRLHGVANGGKVPFYLQTSGGASVFIQNK